MTRPKRSRFRRIFKWTGLVACVVVSGTWMFSLWYGIIYDGEVRSVLNEPIYNVFLMDGHLRIEQCVFSRTNLTIGSNMLPSVVTPTPSSLRLISAPGATPWREIFGLPDIQFYDEPKIRMGNLVLVHQRWLKCSIPLWLMFVSLAIPTSILWYRDRHRPAPGHCQRCGYNLTGNVSGKCSECGKPCEPDVSAT